MRLSTIAALAVTPALLLAACQPSTPPAPAGPVEPMDSTAALTTPPSAEGSLVITGLRFDHRSGGLSGRVENRADVAYDSVEAVISVLTRGRDSLTSITLARDSLGGGSAWHFTRPVERSAFSRDVPGDSVGFMRVERYAGTRRGGERTDVPVRALVNAPTF